MSKLLNKERQEFWHNTKKWHFGIGLDPYDGKYNEQIINQFELIKELASARAENIINRDNIKILNQAITDLTKEIKKLKKTIKTK